MILVSTGLELLSKDFDIMNKLPQLKDVQIDLAIQNDTAFEEHVSQPLLAIGVPIYGQYRFSKIEQYIILNRYKINTPKTYYDLNTIQPCNSWDSFNAFVDLDEFIVKPLRGARGIGVKKLTRQQYKDCIFDRNKVKDIFSNEIQEMEKHSPDTPSNYIRNSFNGEMIAQEVLDITREFRFIVLAGGTTLAYEREKKEGQFCGGLSSGSKPKELSLYEKNKIIQEIGFKVDLIMEEYKYPWLSLDVYTDRNGNTGIIEFQMEFAYEGFDHKTVRESMIEAVNYLIKKHKR